MSRSDASPSVASETGFARYLPYGRQTVGDDDVQAVLEVLRSDYLTTGPVVDAFEAAFARTTDCRHAVAVCNGTAALQLLYAASGIGPENEVICPAITFAATSNAALYLGATPVFADVRPDTLLMDAASVRERITDRTRAIVAVDFAGQPCDYDELQAVAHEAGVPLFADACHAIGGSWHRRPVGSLALASTFSLHPVKHITSGEGGVVTTDDPELADRLRLLRNHGVKTTYREREENRQWEYDMAELGYNFRLSDIHAALGLSQLAKLDGFVRRRRELVALYRGELADMPDVQPLLEREDAYASYHLFVVRIKGARDRVFEAMRRHNIGVNVHYRPVYLHSYYRRELGLGPGLCPVAEAAYGEILTLPLFPAMADDDVRRVVRALREALSEGDGG